MIIGERVEPFLKYALKSVDWVDEIVIVDTSFNGNETLWELMNVNLDIMRLPIKVVKFFQHETAFDFAKARNLAIDHSSGEFILKVDADEVYYNSFQGTFEGLKEGDLFIVEFYHFMLDIFHIQYTEPKEVLFRKDCYRWISKTHETLEFIPSETRTFPRIVHLQDKFCHFGYAQPQRIIFEKWQHYVDLEGRSDWYEGQDPDHILDDRASVSKKFIYEYPEAIRGDVGSFPVVIKDEINPVAKIGLVLGTELNGEEIFGYVEDVKNTADFPIVLVIVLSKCSDEFIERVQRLGYFTIILSEREDLPKILNVGIKFLMKDPDIRWIASGTSGRVAEAIEELRKANVGMVFLDKAFICPVDVYEKLGLFREISTDSSMSDFVNRIRMNNLKVEEL
jgi:glycosyltransferase involved in cell wall biosynthesis